MGGCSEVGFMDGAVSLDECAERLRVSKRTLKRWAQKGWFPKLWRLGRRLYVNKEAAEARLRELMRCADWKDGQARQPRERSADGRFVKGAGDDSGNVG